LESPSWVQKGDPSCARQRSEPAAAAAAAVVVVVVVVANVDVGTTVATPTSTVLSLTMALDVVRQARCSAGKQAKCFAAGPALSQ
jgi:hypothetical protein